MPQIEVTFTIDANGIVNVSAKDLDTGKQQQITIQGSSNMSREEVDRCVREAQQYAAEDSKVQAGNYLEKLLFRAAEVRKSMSKEDRKQLDEVVKQAKTALRKKDTEAMQQLSGQLEAMLNRYPS